jgi:hypothetical protein
MNSWLGRTLLVALTFSPTASPADYHYRFVFAKAAGHTDGKVTRQTLPEALEWLWQGYSSLPFWMMTSPRESRCHSANPWPLAPAIH